MAKKQNEIFKRQNEPEMQRLLVTQHYTYSNAKHWVTILFCILVILPIGINIAFFFNLTDIVSGVLAFISLILLGFGELIRNHILAQKKLVAMLQQKFDIYVFDLNINCITDENLIAQQIEKYKSKDWDRKENWYLNYESLNKNKAIFYCQKENIDWTRNLSKIFCRFLIALIIIFFIIFFINLIMNNSSIIKILSILMASLPFLSYCFSSYKKIKHDNEELLEICTLANEINNNIDKTDEIELVNKINILQTLIYKMRQTKYLIPDWFEAVFHDSLQEIEKQKARERISKERKRQRRK